MNKFVARQGDVAIIRINTMPEGVVKKENKILVHSDSTQHDHTLVGGEVFVDSTGKLFIEVLENGQIVHTMDHEPVTIAAGIYEVRRQVQYLMNDMVKFVVD
jgi:hypothetical protein